MKLSSLNNVLFCITLVLFTFHLPAQSLKVGIIDFPPHTRAKVGSEEPLIQYIDEIFSQQTASIEYVHLPTERALAELKYGRLDIILPLAVSDINNDVKVIPQAIFHSIPGLCFKKENFIPILSAVHRLDSLKIGIPSGVSVVAALKNSNAKLLPLKGVNAISRGIELTQRGRFDAFYHPSPSQVYHQQNPRYKKVACSYFHGYSTPLHIAFSKTLNKTITNDIERAYRQKMADNSYEFFYASRSYTENNTSK